jgi:ribosomal-protein-alanine N-acetyltransferase
VADQGRFASLTFELLQAGDLDELAGLEKECFSLPWSRALFAEELKHPELSHWLLVRDEALPGRPLAGYMGFWKAGDEAHVVNLAVQPGRRGQGLGFELATRILDQARAMGCRRATLEVRATNLPAQRLYEKLGFQTIAVRRRYYSDNQEDALILWNNAL